MENRNAYMNVLFVLHKIGQTGDSFWLYATMLLLVTTALLLIAAGRRSRCEKDGETADEDADISGRELSDKNVEDRNMVDRNTDETGILTIIVDALGGLDNIYDLACSDTRLRVTVNDGTLVNRVRLKMSGALGVLAKKRQVQVFYDDRVECIYRELKGYIDSHRYVECEQEEAGYERVLKKVHVPVEGDVVRVSDIYCLQDVGNGSIGVCAVRATRGEIRAPFDCKAGYSETGVRKIECVSEEGYITGIYIVADGQRNWKHVRQTLNIRLMCDEGEHVRKGKLLAEYPYETYAGMGDQVYAVMEVSAPEMYCDDGMSDKRGGGEKNRNDGRRLRVNVGENANYEYVACEIVK